MRLVKMRTNDFHAYIGEFSLLTQIFTYIPTVALSDYSQRNPIYSTAPNKMDLCLKRVSLTGYEPSIACPDVFLDRPGIGSGGPMHDLIFLLRGKMCHLRPPHQYP